MWKVSLSLLYIFLKWYFHWLFEAAFIQNKHLHGRGFEFDANTNLIIRTSGSVDEYSLTGERTFCNNGITGNNITGYFSMFIISFFFYLYFYIYYFIFFISFLYLLSLLGYPVCFSNAQCAPGEWQTGSNACSCPMIVPFPSLSPNNVVFSNITNGCLNCAENYYGAMCNVHGK